MSRGDPPGLTGARKNHFRGQGVSLLWGLACTVLAAFGWGTGAHALEFSITNTAYANFENEFSQVQPVTASSTSFGVVAGSPNLVVSASASATAPWDGDPVFFALAVFNAGDDSAFNVSILDTLPVLVRYAGSATQSADPGWDPASGTTERLRWTLPQIDIGATAYIYFTAVGATQLSASQAGINGISVDCGGLLPSSATMAFEVWRSAPTAPGTLSAVAGTSLVALAWTPAIPGRDAVSGYLVFRSTGAGVPPTLLGTAYGEWATGYTDPAPVQGVAMCYTVGAVDTVGRPGALTGPECASTPIVTAPLLAVSVSPSTTAPWDGDSVTFRLIIFNGGDNSAFNISVLDTLPAMFSYGGSSIPAALPGWNPAGGAPERLLWSLARLNIGATAIIRFTAVGATLAAVSAPAGIDQVAVTCGGSRVSASSYIELWRSAPSAPGTLSAVAGTSSVALAWTPVVPGRDAVTGYLVYRSAGTGGPPILVASLFGQWSTGYSDATAVPGATMCYRVLAVDALGRLGAPAGPDCASFGAGTPAGKVHVVVTITDGSGRAVKVLEDVMAASVIESVSVADGREYLSIKSGEMVKISLSDGTVIDWDGKSAGGTPVANGFYSVAVTSTLPGGQVKKASDTFALVRAFEKLITTAVFVPNPAREGVWLSFSLASPLAVMTTKIYSIAGELIWKAETTGASYSFKWDLTNRQGTRVVPGLYVAVLEARDPVTGMTERRLLRVAVER